MDQKNYHILIVDDEPLIRESLYEVMRIEGFHAYMAASGEEAYEIIGITNGIMFDKAKSQK